MENPSYPKDRKDNLLINYREGERAYFIYNKDFERIEQYCENECMGIRFLMNANFLRELVRNLLSLNFAPPFGIEEFISEKSTQSLEEKGIIEKMRQSFGTDDLKLVALLVIKQTYNFLNKV